jgi:hypothetical protein
MTSLCVEYEIRLAFVLFHATRKHFVLPWSIAFLRAFQPMHDNERPTTDIFISVSVLGFVTEKNFDLFLEGVNVSVWAQRVVMVRAYVSLRGRPIRNIFVHWRELSARQWVERRASGWFSLYVDQLRTGKPGSISDRGGIFFSFPP